MIQRDNKRSANINLGLDSSYDILIHRDYLDFYPFTFLTLKTGIVGGGERMPSGQIEEAV